MKPIPKPVRLNLETAAREFGVSGETLRRGLHAIGAPTEKGTLHDLVTIYKALAGDLKGAKAREALANAIAKERENRIADRELIPVEENLAWQERVLGPVRARLMALPGVMAQRCNPSDPNFAQAALDEWLKETLPLLRSEIQKAEQV
jgi:hypothetical protein